MSTCAHIAQIPESCALMDAKSGKSFFVSGLGCGIDRQVEVESSGDLGQKKSCAYSISSHFLANTYAQLIPEQRAALMPIPKQVL